VSSAAHDAGVGRDDSTVSSSEVHLQGLGAPHSCSAAHPHLCAAWKAGAMHGKGLQHGLVL